MKLTALTPFLTVTTPTPHPTTEAAAAASGATPTAPADLAGTGSTGMLVIALIVVFLGYLMSLKLHPFSKCPTCKGAGRHKGAVFSYASRPCSSCGGRGVQERLGRRVFFRSSD